MSTTQVTHQRRLLVQEQQPQKQQPAIPKEITEDTLAHHYGGANTATWIDSLPPSWVPYIQLTRIVPPAGLFLTFFPHLFGALLAGTVKGLSGRELFNGSALLFCATFFFSNALHIWNDIVDEPIDKLIPRTRGRPIPRGAVTKRNAFLFTLTQAAATAAFLVFFPADTTFWALTNIPMTAYYPYAKRHTHFPQVVIGIWLGWGVMTAASAFGVKVEEEPATWCLGGACLFWTVISDTIYAYQDREEDIKVGAKSMAVLFGEQTKPMLWTSLAAMITLLYKAGELLNLGLPYYLISVGGCAAALGSMIGTVDLDNKESCWWWFKYGFWMVGTTISAGLFATYTLS